MGTKGHEAEVWADIVAAGGEDIGYGVRIMYTSKRLVFHAGLLLYHCHKDGSVCGGSVTFDLPVNAGEKKLWKVLSWSPLTLSPSIEDKTCSEHLHGYIVNGRWKPV